MNYFEFDSVDQCWITGRGLVITIKEYPGYYWNPGMHQGETVKIDEILWHVNGVEMHRPYISARQPYGNRPIGLLVRRPDWSKL